MEYDEMLRDLREAGHDVPIELDVKGTNSGYIVRASLLKECLRGVGKFLTPYLQRIRKLEDEAAEREGKILKTLELLQRRVVELERGGYQGVREDARVARWPRRHGR
jgi:hypothetical protein